MNALVYQIALYLWQIIVFSYHAVTKGCTLMQTINLEITVLVYNEPTTTTTVAMTTTTATDSATTTTTSTGNTLNYTQLRKTL